MQTKLIALAIALTLITSVSVLAVQTSYADTVIKAKNAIIKRADKVIVKVEGVPGANGKDGTNGTNGTDSTVPGPTGPGGTNGTNGVNGTQLAPEVINNTQFLSQNVETFKTLLDAFNNGSLGSVTVDTSNSTDGNGDGNATG